MEHLEGRECVLAALGARLRRFEVVLLSEGAHRERSEGVEAAAAELGVPVKRLPRAKLDAMAHGRSHGGVMAVCTPRPPTSTDELLDLLEKREEPAFLILLEGTEDARNLGFVLRTAEALGAHAVLVKKHVWDFDGTEVSRASSGSYERIPLVRMDRESDLLSRLKKRGVRVVGCVAGAKRTLFECDLNRPVLLAVGGEKRGLSGAVRRACDRRVSIPTADGASSLSMSHAAAIVMGEARRQRASCSSEGK